MEGDERSSLLGSPMGTVGGVDVINAAAMTLRAAGVLEVDVASL